MSKSFKETPYQLSVNGKTLTADERITYALQFVNTLSEVPAGKLWQYNIAIEEPVTNEYLVTYSNEEVQINLTTSNSFGSILTQATAIKTDIKDLGFALEEGTARRLDIETTIEFVESDTQTTFGTQQVGSA